MAEGFPFGYETGPEKKDAPKRFVPLGRFSGELARPPRIFEKSAGDTPRPDSKSLEFFRPIGGYVLGPHTNSPDVAGQHASVKPEAPKLPSIEHRAEPSGPAKVEKLARLAAEQVEATRRMHELELEKSDDDEVKAERKKSEGPSTPEHKEGAALPPEEFGTLTYSTEGPSEVVSAAEFSEHLSAAEAVSESGTNGLGPGQEQILGQTASANAEFQRIARHEDLARLAAMHLPEMPSIPLGARIRLEGQGDGFNEIVRNSLGGEAPRTARFTERVPGEPPIDNSAGDDRPPNLPPTAEGGAWSGDWSNPNRVRMPSGAIVDVVTWAGLAGLAVRERFHNAQRAMTEAALFGGELLLAAGLIGEHFLAKHRDKELKHTFDKQIRRQNEALGETNQALQQERLQHQRTRRELEDLAAAHTAAEERLNRVSGPSLSTVEAAPGSGLAGTVGATEFADRAGHATETLSQPQAIAERDLATTQIEGRNELGTAVSRPPEIRDADSVAATELAGIAAVQNQETQRREFPEDEAGFNGDTLRLETRHERLQGNLVDNSGRQKTGSADSAAEPGVGLPALQTSTILAAREDLLTPAALHTPADIASRPKVLWIWGIALVILAAALVAIFAL